MTKHSHFPYTSTCSSRITIQTENTTCITSITSTTQTHNILQHAKAWKNTIINNGRYTTNIPTDPHTVTTTDIKTNIRHTHTSIVSRHLATEAIPKYCAHLHHTLAALKRDFNASLVAPLPNSEHINHPSSNHTYTKSTPNHIQYHYASSVHPHTRHTSSLQPHPYTNHVVKTGFVDRPRRNDGTAGQMEGKSGWWTISGKIGLPQLARVNVEGRQQHSLVPDI